MTTLLALDLIDPHPQQPRQEMAEEDIEGLAASIRKHGVIQPITVEEAGGGRYVLHAGHRRVTAARRAGLAVIPANIVPPLDGNGKRERFLRAVIENVQRVNLNPIEEAQAYALMRDEYGLTAREIADEMGVPLSRVSNALALLRMDVGLQALVASGKLTNSLPGLKALQAIPDAEARVKLAERLVERGSGHSPQAVTNAARYLTVQLAAEQKLDSGSSPAMALAIRRVRQPSQKRWDVLKQLGKLPPWAVVVQAAESMCQACALNDVASSSVCSECPGAALLQRMMEAANE